MWLVAAEHLTGEQAYAVGLDLGRNRVILGGPGSGKTLVLAHRSAALIRDRALPRDGVRLLVYTNVLQDYIDVGLADLGLADLCTTFDKWCHGELRALGIRPARGRRSEVFAENRERLRAHLTRRDRHRWRALLVDEGQDLDTTALEILQMSADHVTLAMDTRQELYETGTDAAVACRALGVRRESAHLLEAYRCTPDIVRVAAQYLDDQEAQRFRESNLMPVEQREQPLMSIFADEEQEADALADALQERAFAGQSSIVLLPTNAEVADTRKKLADRGLTVRVRGDDMADDVIPKILTYYSAKGLTVDSVFLPRMTAKSFERADPATVRRLMFVALTRATHWVWVGTVDPIPDLLSGLLPLIDEGIVVRRDGVGDFGPKRSVGEPGVPVDGGDEADNGFEDLF